MTPYLSYGCRDKDSRTSQAYLIRSAGGDDFAVLVSDGDPIARATGEGAARNGDHRPQRMLTHRTDVLAQRIENPIPHA